MCWAQPQRRFLVIRNFPLFSALSIAISAPRARLTRADERVSPIPLPRPLPLRKETVMEVKRRLVTAGNKGARAKKSLPNFEF